jgi:repressor LexA
MPKVNGTTQKQLLVLEFIKAYIEMKGHPPSMQDIATGLGMKSRSNIHRIVHSLRTQGKLSVNPNKVRTIKVTDRSVKEMAAL